MKRFKPFASAWLVAAAAASAQMHVVKKPETVVRAVGVYEWTGELTKPTACRLVPVSLFIDAQLEDAGVYLARPIPFALSTGTVFELDQAGVPEGTVELAFARHLQSTGANPLEDAWLGYGLFKPQPAPKLVAANPRRGSQLPQVVVSNAKPGTTQTGTGPTFSKPAADDDSSQPTLHRKSGSNTAESTAAPASTTAATPGQTASTTKPAASTDDDDDRPTLVRRPGSSDGTPISTDSTTTTASQTASTTKPDTSTTDDEADRPTLRRRSEADRQASRKSGSTASVSAGSNLNDDPDRPSLHRGPAPGSLSPDSLPPLTGTPADMKQRVAVSDAASRPMHDFARPWASDAERAETLTKLQTMARARLAAYDSVSGKSLAAAPAAPVHSAASRPHKTKPAAPPALAELDQEELHAYTLSYGGDATYIYTASSPGPAGITQYVSVIAQQSPTEDLKPALASVTDSSHLDRTPWMRLVDAVDAEASNRASLLMELRAKNSRQFALYRVIGSEAQQTFITGTTD